MHELSIAHEIVDLAGEQLLRSGAGRATAITLRLGVLSGVVPAALRSAFPAAAAGSAVDGAVLRIEEVQAVIFCQACGEERTLSTIQSRRCPACGHPARDVVRGAEMEVSEIEVE